ncbi:amidohydrolase/deacetylase family metallohydrolase [Bombilactobacillus bombi]|uniref:Amidohydrolase/deacetylase family metallohydrolase n=1 Tax=Bombilactobacillus bombi TaxID=1303590 RepID=A0A3R6YNW2_9LACO|nr:amidohydrolase/deacetylase family metallohydrolase [Bombilactobacillus bombi]RHW45633.1 amidohydrolase/deacetylase family metallohydrolase [Bombilactobacillus bombi]
MINGKTVNKQPIDVAIKDKQIIAIDKNLSKINAMKTIDLESKYFISPGWIDDHTHCYEKLTLYFDDPDEDGYKTGVTTVIDAGSTGANNIGDFYNITRSKITNVLAMINVSKTGILDQDELGNLKTIDSNLLYKIFDKYKDFIVGIKVRESHSVVIDNNVKPLIAGKKIQKELGNPPLMVHIGANPPELQDVLSLMEEKDILTHAYNGKINGILDKEGNVQNFVWQAYQRGVIFDVGHGTDSFNFNTAKVAKEVGLNPKSISTDIYNRNRIQGPVYDMATTLEKMIYLGYSLSEVIKMVTEAPANNFNLRSKGHLQVGYDGDLTIFSVSNGEKVLTDSNGNQKKATTLINPQLVVIGGQIYKIGGN